MRPNQIVVRIFESTKKLNILKKIHTHIYNEIRRRSAVQYQKNLFYSVRIVSIVGSFRILFDKLEYTNNK